MAIKGLINRSNKNKESLVVDRVLLLLLTDSVMCRSICEMLFVTNILLILTFLHDCFTSVF